MHSIHYSTQSQKTLIENKTKIPKVELTLADTLNNTNKGVNMEFKKWTEKLEMPVGPQIEIEISIEVHEDDIDIGGDFDFGDAAENEKYQARFTSGELFMGHIAVYVKALGELGSDHLGGCHLFSNNFFDSKPFEKSVNELLIDHCMVENAKNDLISTIRERANKLAPYA